MRERATNLAHAAIAGVFLVAPQLALGLLQAEALIVSALVALVLIYRLITNRFPQHRARLRTIAISAGKVVTLIALAASLFLLICRVSTPHHFHEVANSLICECDEQDVRRPWVLASLLTGIGLEIAVLALIRAQYRDAQVSSELALICTLIQESPLRGQNPPKRTDSKKGAIEHIERLMRSCASVLDKLNGDHPRFALWLAVPRLHPEAPSSIEMKNRLAANPKVPLSTFVRDLRVVHVWTNVTQYLDVIAKEMTLPLVASDAEQTLFDALNDTQLLGLVASQKSTRAKAQQDGESHRVSGSIAALDVKIRKQLYKLCTGDRLADVRDALKFKASVVGVAFDQVSDYVISDCDVHPYVNEKYLDRLPPTPGKKSPLRMRSAVAQRLTRGGNRYGVLLYSSTRRNAFRGANLRFVQALQPILADFLAEALNAGALAGDERFELYTF